MAPSYSYPHSGLVLVIVLLVLLQGGAGQSLNLSQILSGFPEFSEFNRLLSSTPLPSEVSGRSSLTLLAVPNKLLRRTPPPPAASLPDSLRFHVLLQFLQPPDLLRFPPSGHLLTSLFQTTGRAPNNLGALNVSTDPTTATTTVRPLLPSAAPATLLSLLTSLPYNLSIFSVSALLLPLGLDPLTISSSSSSASAPSPPLNITRPLLAARSFFVAASLLSASGVLSDFESDESGAGITFFVPTDDAFSVLPTSLRLQSLPADQKSTLLKFHVLHSYYPLGSLESIVNPVQPTLATEDRGAGRFTLNITRVNGSVAIDTGLVQASITQTVFDQNPLAIFAVSRVLLPREIFGGEGGLSAGRTGGGVGEGGEAPLGAPASSPPGMESPAATHLSSESSPPGLESTSSTTAIKGGSALMRRCFCWCLVGCLYLFV